jgi:hypothetical protein
MDTYMTRDKTRKFCLEWPELKDNNAFHLKLLNITLSNNRSMHEEYYKLKLN